jgi:hypothetical protein
MFDKHVLGARLYYRPGDRLVVSGRRRCRLQGGSRPIDLEYTCPQNFLASAESAESVGLRNGCVYSQASQRYLSHSKELPRGAIEESHNLVYQGEQATLRHKAKQRISVAFT